MTSALLLAIAVLDIASAVASLVVRPPLGRRIALGGLAAAGVLAVILGGLVLAGGSGPAITLHTGMPTGPLHFQVDPLAALFLVLAGTLVLGASIYADGYLSHAPRTAVRAHLAVFALLAASIVAVLAAADAIAFLMAWEVLAWSAYLAVILDIDDPNVSRAAFLMLAVSELGTAALLAAFVILGGNGFEFGAMVVRGTQIGEPLRSLLFWAIVFGFGAKAGIVPLQLWLPEAHPAAPSHVSALLSAIIVELGLYGIVRFAIVGLPDPAAWWGPALAALGALSASVGVLWALMQRDLKRVLAYSTIENVGLIVAALGLAETFRATGLGALATLALVAALYHVATHAFGKSVLFLGAGSVDHATGTRDLDRLGGLARRMPVTSLGMLLGVLSVAAIAPFGGFLSEWMILETFLQSPAIPLVATRLVIVAAGALLALTAATAVLVFARLFATGFVGRPRSRGAVEATEAPRSMRIGIALVLGPLLAIGFLPVLALALVDRAVSGLVGPDVLASLVPPLFTSNPGAYSALVAIGGATFRGLLPVNGLVIIPAPGLSTIVSPTYLALFEAGFIGITALAVRTVRRLGSDRRAPAWAGGIPATHAAAQYTATAYANPLRLIFDTVFRSRTTLRLPDPASMGGDGILEYEQDALPPFERELYRPILGLVGRIAELVKILQSGDANAYVGYILAVVALVLLLRVL
jgi:hydrogenase-4 component B